MQRGLYTFAIVAALLVSGCLAVEPAPQPGLLPPEGGTWSPTRTGGVLEIPIKAIPFALDIEIPEGVTEVTALVEHEGEGQVSVVLRNADTGRRRCSPWPDEGWSTASTGTRCAALTVVDVLPATWTVEVRGPDGPATLRLVFRTTPLDGAVSHLDLDRLSRPVFGVVPTKVLKVPSWDGTPLHLEVTLPDGEGPFPAVLAIGPYNEASRAAGEPTMYRTFVLDWAKRGYAVVTVDVRGTGDSEGCLDVWGETEQRDSAFVVEWVSSQPWSTGAVGAYGVSYLGTTALQAAVRTPSGLKAVLVVAPVPDPYHDWHFGGVPNGEETSAANYQVYQGSSNDATRDDLRHWMEAHAGRACGSAPFARAADPRAEYDAFYAERNLTASAGNVEAAVLYAQGYYDMNVKSAQIGPFIDALRSPTLALVGPWTHELPPRADLETLFIAWLDHYVKGVDLGVDRLPRVLAVVADAERAGDAWPAPPLAPSRLYPRWERGDLAHSPASGRGELILAPAPLGNVAMLRFRSEETWTVGGAPSLRLAGTLQGAANAHLTARLSVETSPGESRLLTFGMANLAHRHGHDRYEPVRPGETFAATLAFLPVESRIGSDTTLLLEIRAVEPSDWILAQPGPPGVLSLLGGPQGSFLEMPTSSPTGANVLPISVGGDP